MKKNRVDQMMRAFEWSVRALAQEAGVQASLFPGSVWIDLPMAFGQVMVRDMEPRFPDSASFVTEGTENERRVFLPEDPLWREALRLAEKAYAGGALTGEQFGALALRSSTIHALNNALHAGSKPEDLVFAPSLIVLSVEAGAELYQQVPALRTPPPTPPPPSTPAPPPRKPWWKFW